MAYKAPEWAKSVGPGVTPAPEPRKTDEPGEKDDRLYPEAFGIVVETKDGWSIIERRSLWLIGAMETACLPSELADLVAFSAASKSKPPTTPKKGREKA